MEVTALVIFVSKCAHYDIAVRSISFRDVELHFVDEYVEVLHPVAPALDRLQGQRSASMSYMGALIPALLTVKQKLSDLSVSPAICHCTPMVSSLLNALNKRFGMLVNLESAA